MTKMSPEHVSGYVIGEGCFYAESGKDYKYRLGHRIRLAFSIEVREQDRELLETVQEYLGCGNIYHLDFGRYVGYKQKKWKRHVKYRVSNFDDLYKKVIPFFRKYPLFGMKLKSFDIFSEIAEKMINKEHLTESGLNEIKLLVKQLRQINKRGPVSG